VSDISESLPSKGFQRINRWLRFRFYPEIGWRKMISDSGLPDQVTSIVSRVVSESKLSGFEKAQVAEELLSHFEDGNQRGNTFTELIDDFGDPATAAALIRISKLRNRSMMSKIFHGGMWTGLAGLACFLKRL